jgi:RNA polymerase sigma factor (sigma-70 family)
MAVRTAPASFEELVEQYDHFIDVAIFRISRGQVRSDDLPDLKQAVYARIWQFDYLVKYHPAKGSFSNYLFVLIRSVLANQFDKNTRNPLNMAIGVRETPGQVGPRADVTRRLVLEAHRDFVDHAFERRQQAEELLAKLEARALPLPDGQTLAAVLRLLYDGYTQREISKRVGRSLAKVAELRRRLQTELAADIAELVK